MSITVTVTLDDSSYLEDLYRALRNEEEAALDNWRDGYDDEQETYERIGHVAGAVARAIREQHPERAT